MLSLPGKVYDRVVERRIQPILETGIRRNTGPALYPPWGA